MNNWKFEREKKEKQRQKKYKHMVISLFLSLSLSYKLIWIALLTSLSLSPSWLVKSLSLSCFSIKNGLFFPLKLHIWRIQLMSCKKNSLSEMRFASFMNISWFFGFQLAMLMVIYCKKLNGRSPLKVFFSFHILHHMCLTVDYNAL